MAIRLRFPQIPKLILLCTVQQGATPAIQFGQDGMTYVLLSPLHEVLKIAVSHLPPPRAVGPRFKLEVD